MSSRPRRTTRKKTAKEIDPSHYLGYVDDFETPESIMKKFEALEQLNAKKAKENEINLNKINKKGIKSSKCEMDEDDEDDDMIINNNIKNNNDLTEEEKLWLFKQTSAFTVASVQDNNQIFFDKPIISEDGEFITGYDETGYKEDYAYMADYNIDDPFFENENEDEYYIDEYNNSEDEYNNEFNNDEYIKSNKIRKSGYSRKRGNGLTGIDFGSSLGISGNMDVSINKKKCYHIETFDIPNYPIPHSWMSKIIPYKSEKEINDELIGYYYNECNILQFNINNYINQLNMNKNDGYLGVLMDPPIDTINGDYFIKQKGLFTMQQFSDAFTKEFMLKLCPKGMLFIWIESQLISEMVELTEKWGFKFVEHACWVMKRPNNKLALINKYGLCESKKNLFLFRRINETKSGDGYYKIELRHQRTTDTYADFIRYHPINGNILKSNYQYQLIETLLPSTIRHLKKNINKNIKQQSNLLYLWSPQNEKRIGWSMLNDPQLNKLYLDQFNENNIVDNNNNIDDGN